MIYTITTNPSLDYYLKINDSFKDGLNRSEEEKYDAAGKGVNVSKVLNDLNITSIALGFLGGYPKEHYLDLLTKFDKIQPQFIMINDNTRINVKIEGEKEISINAKGPVITDQEFERFNRRLYNIYKNDYVVLSGNVQDELKERIIKAMIELIDNGVKIIIDSDNDIVERILPHHPFLIKTSFDDVGHDKEVIFKTAKDYLNKGAKYFLYSAPHNSSFLFSQTEYFECDLKDKLESIFTGSNDTMIAGLLFALLKAADMKEAFTYANALTLSLNHIYDDVDFSLINKNYAEIEIKRFDF